MTVVWPLPCHVVNDFLPKDVLIIAPKINYSNIIFDTGGLLVDSSASVNKYAKYLDGIIIVGEIDFATLPMANSNTCPSCSFKERAADGGSSSSHGIETSTRASNSFVQSDSHLQGNNSAEACEGEPGAVKWELSNLPLQSADKEENTRNEDSGNFDVDVHCKLTDYPINPEDEQHAHKLTAVGGRVLEKNSIFPDTNVASNLGGIHLASGIGMEGQHRFEEVKENANHVQITNVERLSDSSSSGLADHNSSVSLRAWISNPERVIDKVENLHIFRQIAEFVELAHSQGVVLRNVRPSSFLLSSMCRVSIIESASSGTSSGSSAESTGRDTAVGLVDGHPSGPSMARATDKDSAFTQQTDYEIPIELAADCRQRDALFGKEIKNSRCGSAADVRQVSLSSKDKCIYEEQGSQYLTSSSSEHAEDQFNDQNFPLKEILSLELMWYKSPEELNGGTPDFPSDVYSLGVLFLELFCSSESQGQWSRAMSDIRHRLLPPSFLLDYPKEANFCLLLLHPNSDCRPKAREILHADIFTEIEDKLAEREAIMKLDEKLLEAETTLDFLQQMQQKKHVIVQKLAKELKLLDEDIKEVERWQALLLKNRQQKNSFDNSSSRLVDSPMSDIRGFRLLNDQSFTYEESLGSGCSRGRPSGRRQELLLKKSSQLMRSFTILREAYLSLRENHSGSRLTNKIVSRQIGSGQRPHTEEVGVSRVLNSFRGSIAEQVDSEGRLGSFFDEFCKFMKYSRFDVKATLQYGDILNTKSMVCSVNFDCDDEFFATAGVSKRIKIFDCNALLGESNDMPYPVIEMNNKAKLSCVCWNNFRKSYLASSDLGGAVQLWDVTAGQTVMEFKEHGKCAWSVDFSRSDPSKLASGSDDCCVKLWSTNQGTSVGTIRTKANICSVQFSLDHSHILAFGSADSQVYFHDLRYIRIPVCILTGHQKAVSFIRFLGPTGILSASTDSTLKLWDLTKTSANARGYGASLGSRSDCITTYTGHTNVKNFVGLSVLEENYIACGSETNEVFVYHKSLPVTMLSHEFKNVDPISGRELEGIGDQFVSSVCWRNKSQILVTANSVGNIQVLEMV